MNIDLTHVNWLAVIVAALVTFFIGGAWYTALFGKYWLTHSKYPEDLMKEMQTARPMPVFFGLMVLAYFVIAFAVALIVQATGANSAVDGVKLGLILWLIAAGVAFTAHISSPKGWGAYYVDAGYQLAYLPLMGAILAAWR